MKKEKKTNRFSFILTDTELKALNGMAKLNNIDVSKYIRSLIEKDCSYFKITEEFFNMD